MEFEVINEENKVVMTTSCINCVPSEEQITIMVKNGYKFKIDGKIISQKKIKEFVKSIKRDNK